MTPDENGVRPLGFACAWDDPPERTWSYTPWMLREALRSRTDVHAYDVEPSRQQRRLMTVPFTHLNPRRPAAGWRYARVNELRAERLLKAQVAASPVPALLQISDIAVLDLPFYLYQDLSWDLLLQYRDTLGPSMLGIAPVRRATMLHRRDRQHRFYAAAAGVFCMSHWLARHLVGSGLVDASKVHVVHAGTSAVVPAPPAARSHGRRLLFVGRHFRRKGGDLVVRALSRVRRDLDPTVTLTVVGPDRWPLDGPVPEGVDFRGRLPADEVSSLWSTHDAFVLPSRFEPFGIVLAEAAAAGLPVVARDAYAMPELVRHGDTGYLVRGDDTDELAERIVDVLGDEAMRERCRAAATTARLRFTWQRVADDMLAVING